MSPLSEILLLCNQTAVIKQVIAERGLPEITLLLDTGFSNALSPESIDAGLQFLKDIQTFGRADNRSLTILINRKSVAMDFSGVLLSGHLFISGSCFGGNKTANDLPETISYTAENLPFFDVQAEVNQMEMFEELSRLNNELINAKRELIRKNKELERLYDALKRVNNDPKQ